MPTQNDNLIVDVQWQQNTILSGNQQGPHNNFSCSRASQALTPLRVKVSVGHSKCSQNNAYIRQKPQWGPFWKNSVSSDYTLQRFLSCKVSCIIRDDPKKLAYVSCDLFNLNEDTPSALKGPCQLKTFASVCEESLIPLSFGIEKFSCQNRFIEGNYELVQQDLICFLSSVPWHISEGQFLTLQISISVENQINCWFP